MRTIALFFLFFIFFLSFFLKLFAIFWRFYLANGRKKPRSRTSPTPSPKSEVRSPSPTWKTLVRKPNNCSQFDQDEAVTAATCARQVAVTLATGPEYRTIVTSYAYLDAVTGVSLVYLGKKPNNCDIPKPGRSRHRTKKNPRSVMQLGFLPNKLKDLARSPPHLQDLLCPICLTVSISQSPSKMIFIKIEVLVAL